MSKSEIRPLTGVRGVAACWVVLFHMNQEAGLSGLGGNMVKHGYLAVDVFFILSGFVMAMSYRSLFDRGFSRQSYITFLLRRVARVWPLYAVTTLCYAALYGAGFGSGRVTAGMLAGLLPLNLAMLQAWGFGESINYPSWSISTEFAAYLLFPWFAWLFLFARPAVAAVASGFAFLALGALPALAGHAGLNGLLDVYRVGTVWPLVKCLLEFPLGLATYRLAMHLPPSATILRPVATWGLAAILLGLLTIPGTDLIIVGLVPLFLIQLASTESGVSGLLGSAPAHFVGTVSYAIYLIHWLLLPVLRSSRLLEGVMSATAASVVVQALLYLILFVVSTAAYRFIEMPGRRWVNRVAARLYPQQTRGIKTSEAIGSGKLC